MKYKTFYPFIFILALFSCCKYERRESPRRPSIDTDTAYHTVRVELLSPNENHLYEVYDFRLRDPGFANKKFIEFSLSDSLHDGQYRLRFYTVKKHFFDTAYLFTPDKLSNYQDKVYAEFYRYGANNNEYVFTSEMQQNYSYLTYSENNKAEYVRLLQFRFLSQEITSNRFGVISGRIRY